LERLRAAQHLEVRTVADERLEAFLAEISPACAQLDLMPATDIELRHLTHARRTA
jgi:hypothetical protein